VQFPLQSAITPSDNQNCDAINVTVGQTLYSAAFSLPFWAVAVLMATVCQSAVTYKAKNRHYIPKAKNFEGSNRFQSPFARKDTHFRHLSTANEIRDFNFARRRYLVDKRRTIFVLESKGTWLGVFVKYTWKYTAWVTHSVVPRHYKQERPRVYSTLLIQLASQVIPRWLSEMRQDCPSYNFCCYIPHRD
jgi:hypothetical protein